MAADPDRYAGREQARVKHYFLRIYLERLIHKIASAYDEVAYVDGFSGPWQSTNENYEDTSFGIALQALRAAKNYWKDHGRDVRMSAFLVERSVTAYRKLATVKDKFPDIELSTYNEDFIEIAAILSTQIPPKAFAFVLIDPKGWNIDIMKLAPLLQRANSEVVFNFMFDFINRAASMNEPATIAGLNALMPFEGWREKLSAALTSEARKGVLIEAFRETLMKVGNYRYVAETPVLRPLKDRTLYSLFYGTRQPPGIEVFRDCQIKTLREQDRVRIETKIKEQQRTSGQGELFASSVPVRDDDLPIDIEKERLEAERTLLELTPKAPHAVAYGEIWPLVLAKHAVRRTELNNIAARLKKSESLLFPEWGVRKRVPDDGYRMSRP
ncbi:MAG TPA: three-Cys-motif partner protein TcmP [Rhizomicrobium sp.]|nr:three-Cys-motif partner protein TcmP [Rhizomicrobium sp.]